MGGGQGLIDLFNRYKFTVEENTPVEQEVALDPELLGNVFENLLAALNPETRENVRKKTGSYYTPRVVVDYMVNEALVGTLAEKVSPKDDNTDSWQKYLRILLDYNYAFDNNAGDLFSSPERESLIRAIANLKVLDPAVGSGAFPMGILHKLTLALRRLDPENTVWKRLQRENASQRATTAFNTDDRQERDAKLDEVSDVFEHYRDSDFGRKLYLIQNSIYGVDIQPTATQIPKLRFFISLAIEQQPTSDVDKNYGIKPLPNLETRFVTADTLRHLYKPKQMDLGQTGTVNTLELSLVSNRERHFHASTHKAKLECRKHDADLRHQLTKVLQNAGLPAVSAEQISSWNPFEQNIAADWFDAEYMFGVTDGFDVVIANPPYVRQEEIKPEDYKAALVKQYSDAVTARSDLYCHFYTRGIQLLRDGGLHVFICSNSWLDVNYGTKLQEYLLDNTHVQTIYETASQRQFANADINTIISIIRKVETVNDDDRTHFILLRGEFETALNNDNQHRVITKTRKSLRTSGTRKGEFVGDKWGAKYLRAPNIYHHILKKYASKLIRLGDVANVLYGIKTGAKNFFCLTQEHINKFGIEPEYCRPVMSTPKESLSIAIDPNTLPKRLFMCHKEKTELVGTGTLSYIKWGEAQGYHNNPTTRSRPRWYDLGKQRNIHLGINCVLNTTARTFLATQGVLFTNNFQVIEIVDNISPLTLCTAVNSTLFQLMINTEGRSSLGGGGLGIQTYEVANLTIVNPQFLPYLDIELFTTDDWDMLNPSPARLHLDKIVFDALGLTSDERKEVYDSVTELIENRLQKSKSL